MAPALMLGLRRDGKDKVDYGNNDSALVKVSLQVTVQMVVF